MRNKILFILSIAGLAAGLLSAYIYGVEKKPAPPAFSPASNPYKKGIYSNGIIESYQSNGENINIYPEITGTVTGILVTEGETVKKGTSLIKIDDSVQRALVEQQKSQSEAARSLLDALKAQPRKENLEVSKAQVELAAANYKSAEDQFEKQKRSYDLNPKSVSRDTFDNVKNAAQIARANLDVARRQYELTKAGAWVYDIKNQENQYRALSKAYAASNALLSKYTITAPVDGVVLSIKAAVGSYISPQGAYGTYTGGLNPVLVMGSAHQYMGLRCYIDEILVNRLPKKSSMNAKMFIRGTNINIPLEYVRVQPYVTPKIELSNQRTERVDLRVLPIIFKFKKPEDLTLYPGQLVDVYIGES